MTNIQFPQIFDIKIITEATITEKKIKKKLKTLFEKLEIPFNHKTKTASATKKYISYTVNITIETDVIFKSLYAALKKIPEIKMAL